MNKNFSYKMDCFLDEYYKNNKNFGVLRVTVKDEIIYEKFISLADIENNVNFSKKSMFTLYSISKAFCAIGLMKLADKGLIDINCHPGVYLQESRMFHPYVPVNLVPGEGGSGRGRTCVDNLSEKTRLLAGE